MVLDLHGRRDRDGLADGRLGAVDLARCDEAGGGDLGGIDGADVGDERGADRQQGGGEHDAETALDMG